MPLYISYSRRISFLSVAACAVFSLNSPFRLLLEINKQTPACMKKLPKGTILTTKILHELLVCVHYY